MLCFSAVLLTGLLGNLCGQGCDSARLRVPVCGEDGHEYLQLQPFDPKPGDMVFFRANNFVENVLYFLSCAGGPTHCGMVVARQDGSLGLLEAPGSKYPVMLSDIPSRLSFYNGRVWVRRLRCPLTAEQSANLTAFACAQEGKRFDTIGIFRPIFGFPKRGPLMGSMTCREMDQPRWFCSALVTAAGVAAGIFDPDVVRPLFTDPQDLMKDRCLNLSTCYERYVPWLRCGTCRPETWESQPCCGSGEVSHWR